VILRRLVPQPDESVDLDAADARARISEFYRLPRPDWLRLNLVGTVSGAATGPDGTSESITNPVDRLILRVIRSLADVVLVGAASVRAEGYFVPRTAALAVVSRSGDFSHRQLASNEDHGPILVLCPAASVDRVRATVGDPSVRPIAVPDTAKSLSAPAIVTALRSEGYASIVAEGGPTIAAELVAGGVVDELCLTTSPMLNGAALPLLGASQFDPIPLDLTQLLVDDSGATYARWSMATRSPSAGV
jgi:riboflavin biosynthesis pyrimidine reductase